MLTVYGIKNCTTVKKALALLDQCKWDYDFIDHKKIPPNQAQIVQFLTIFGEQLINKKGTTYRKLDDTQKAVVLSVLDDIALTESPQHDKRFDEFCCIIKDNTSLLKRPIVLSTPQNHEAEHHNQPIALIGFDENLWRDVLNIS